MELDPSPGACDLKIVGQFIVIFLFFFPHEQNFRKCGKMCDDLRGFGFWVWLVVC